MQDFTGRYARNRSSITAEEQVRLAGMRVAVAGCGGLGGYVIEQLARVGVGCIVCIDADVFEPSNLNRQLLCTQQNLGCSKARTAAERVALVNSDVRVIDHDCLLDTRNAAELIAGCDCVVDCLDSHESRFTLSQACLAQEIPLVFGAISGWYGQVAVVYPGDVLYATVYGAVGEEDAGASQGEADDAQNDAGLEADDAQNDAGAVQGAAGSAAGNLPFTCAVTAGFQAAECVKVLLGKPDVIRNSILLIDLFDGACERT